MSDELIVNRYYAIYHMHEWHIATWDGDAFCVLSLWQSGDRWIPEWVDNYVILPDQEAWDGKVEDSP